MNYNARGIPKTSRVIDNVRRPIDTFILQILELIQKMPESSLSWLYLNKCFVAHLTPYGGRNRGSGPPSGGSSVLHLHRQQNMKKNTILSIKMSDIDLPRSPDRESCP
jgi:hypothetical protein